MARRTGEEALPLSKSPSQPEVLRAMPKGPPQDEVVKMPVRGDLDAAANLPEQGAPVPIMIPGITAIMLAGPRGSTPGSMRS